MSEKARPGLGRKRTLDIALAACGLIALSPPIAAIGLAIRLSMGKPVLFRQLRPGYHAEPLEMVKFRSMWGERDEPGHLIPQHSAQQARRHKVQPGLTGLAQIKGRHHLPWHKRYTNDLYCVGHWSLRLDAKTILKTFPVALRGDGRRPADYFAVDDQRS